MTNIHLPSIKTFVYTIQRHIDRHARIEEMMRRLGFTNWSFIFGESKHTGQNYWKNIHDDFVKMLTESSEPFLLLEDDATDTEHYEPEIVYPDNAQLVYLGGTSNGEGRHLTKIRQEAKLTGVQIQLCRGKANTPSILAYSECNEDYIYTYNMHSTHAILFVDVPTQRLIAEQIDKTRQVPTDVVMAWTMCSIVTCCRKKPFWFQKDGRNDRVTTEYYP